MFGVPLHASDEMLSIGLRQPEVKALEIYAHASSSPKGLELGLPVGNDAAAVLDGGGWGRVHLFRCPLLWIWGIRGAQEILRRQEILEPRLPRRKKIEGASQGVRQVRWVRRWQTGHCRMNLDDETSRKNFLGCFLVPLENKKKSLVSILHGFQSD